MVDPIVRQSPVARTPVSQPVPGKSYEHVEHGYVTVKRIEDGMVVFKRQTPTGKRYHLNTRQEPIETFVEKTVDPS
jgi:hypothetical protein